MQSGTVLHEVKTGDLSKNTASMLLAAGFYLPFFSKVKNFIVQDRMKVSCAALFLSERAVSFYLS